MSPRRLLLPTRAELPPIRAWGPWWAGIVVVLAFVAIVYPFNQIKPHGAAAGVILEAALLVILLAVGAWRRTTLPRPTAMSVDQRFHWIVIGAVTILAVGAVTGPVLKLITPHEMEGIGHTLPDGTGPKVLAGIAMVVLAPIVEETVFRGWMLRSLATRVAPGAAAIITGITFGSLHVWLARYSLGKGFELIFVGMALCYLCLHSGSLVPNIAGHMFLNFCAFFSIVSKPVSVTMYLLVLVTAVVLAVRAHQRSRRARAGRAATVAA
jgi:membrane protease YdiL (CAAX protease family)